MFWVKCGNCEYEMSADLRDCSCEQCEECQWSEPYSDGDTATDQEEFKE